MNIDYRLQLKQQLKTLAQQIKDKKSKRKDSPWSGFVPGLFQIQYAYRHMHIAYCLLRGKTYEQIENKVRENNKPNELYIEYWKTLDPDLLTKSNFPRWYHKIALEALSSKPTETTPVTTLENPAKDLLPDSRSESYFIKFFKDLLA